MDRLGAMETFVRVAETKSFSAAARDLRVGQPAVSKSIAQLEEQFGVRLVMRSTRGLTMTEAGQHFYERARRIVDDAHDAVTAVSGTGNGICGRLRVSAGVTIARLHIVPQLPAFLDRHPQLSLDLLLSDRQEDLIREGADVCLRTGTLNDTSVIARKIATCRRLVIGTPAFFERSGTPEAPGDLAQIAAVIYTTERAGGGEVYAFRQEESEVDVRLSGPLRVSAAEAVRAAVLSGLGYAVASEWMFAPELATGAVRAVLGDWLLPTLDCWALFPAGRMMTAKARAFASFAQAVLAKTTKA